MPKITYIYGVEMTKLQEMKFERYRTNHGIAMNTLTSAQRYVFAKNWLDNHIAEGGKMVK